MLCTAVLISAFGCGSDDLPNRVAVEVAVQIGTQKVSDGSLILRPQPGVKCPLIRIPIVNGDGYLSQSAGPVPGNYRATYRPGAVTENLTKQLKETGRVTPSAAGNASSAPPSSTADVLMPNGDKEVTVPDKNPAFVAISFDPA